MHTAPSWPQLLAYGVLSLPLSFAALPLYVHVPQHYSSAQGLSLAVVGGLLLLTRLLDAISDPLLGWASDRLARRRLLTAVALLPFACGISGLLRPPAGAGALWLGVMLMLAYGGYSLASLNYSAWAAEAGHSSLARTRLTAAREACGLIGVLLAAALPGMLGEGSAGLTRLPWVFLPLLAVAGAACLLAAPRPQPVAVMPRRLSVAALVEPLRAPRFRALLAVFALNGIAAAVPASLVLFYINDVLREPARAGLFLGAYFLTGALGIPLWLRIARRVGTLRAWGYSMFVAVLGFAAAAGLGAGDATAYLLVCLAAGFALGADLCFPPALLAEQLAASAAASTTDAHTLQGGLSFGWWNLVAKLNLALAAGIALPALQWMGYAPGQREPLALAALVFVYAVLPLLLKLAAAALLWRLRHVLETVK